MKTIEETVKIHIDKTVKDSVNDSVERSVRDSVQFSLWGFSLWGFVENCVWISICEQVSIYLSVKLNKKTFK